MSKPSKADYDYIREIVTAVRGQTGYSSLSEGEKNAVLSFCLEKSYNGSIDDGRGEIE